MSPTRSIATRAADVVLGEDDVLRVLVHPGTDVHADDMRAFLAARMELAPHPVAVIIDQRKIRTMTREAQEVATTPDSVNRPTICVALLVDGPIAVMIANFFIIFARPRYPTRLFTTEEAALAWIETWRARHAEGAVRAPG